MTSTPTKTNGIESLLLYSDIGICSEFDKVFCPPSVGRYHEILSISSYNAGFKTKQAIFGMSCNFDLKAFPYWFQEYLTRKEKKMYAEFCGMSGKAEKYVWKGKSTNLIYSLWKKSRSIDIFSRKKRRYLIPWS